MKQVSWFYEESEKRSGRMTRISDMIIDVEIAPNNNVVDFNVTLKHGRVESVIKFSENPPAEAQTNDEVVKWVENNIDQLVQNALVKLLTTAVGFFD